MTESVHDFTARTIMGLEKPLSDYKGKVLLIVNTASKCGFTPQYEGLQKLYGELKDKGFEILGFPCNQFASQEPGTTEEIQNFCQVNFGVTFPLFDKIDVNGPDAHPLYKFLTERAPGILGSKPIKWNFTKFLIDANGNPVKRYASSTTPESIRPDVEALLEKT